MFAVTQNHHRQSHWFVNNIVRHCRWIMAHLVLHFSGQLRSICCCIFFSSSSLLNLPLSAHTNTNTDTSVQFENNKRKAMCLAQLLNSCLVCVSWGGCTSVAGPSIRPMHGPQTSRYKDDKYPHLWKRAGGGGVGETDGWMWKERGGYRYRNGVTEGGVRELFGAAHDTNTDSVKQQEATDLTKCCWLHM